VTTFHQRSPSRIPPPVWLTRDRTCGVLVDEVEVWAMQPPHRFRFENGDVVWLCEPVDDLFPRDSCAILLGTWALHEATRLAGDAVPRSDIECVRVPHRRSRRADAEVFS
jgi:hypothetical protein